MKEPIGLRRGHALVLERGRGIEMKEPIGVERWGRDHHSTLLYAETRAVDHGGVLTTSDKCMRRDGSTYPTRLKDGVVEGHNDYDCLADAVACGFITYEGQRVRFTNAGWSYVHGLRRARAEQ
jgi:hypothetical protein